MTESNQTLSRAKLLEEIDTHWRALDSYVASLTEAQLTQPTDAAGWTVKDHLMHIALWEKGALAMLNRQSKREAMEIDQATWEMDDDPINAAIQARYQALPPAEALQILDQQHEAIMQKLNSMSEADLQLPYSHYQPDSNDEHPLVAYLVWDTYNHYRDHLPWIKAIVDGEAAQG